MTPTRRADDAITNAAELSADDVAHQRVVCPCCSDFVFRMWPEGWDAHAEHRCAGLTASSGYRLIAPGSEWRLHGEWFGRTALADLLGADFSLAESHKLYACHDLLLKHKQALFDHLVGRWRDLFNASFEVLLYDLTSTYFESDPPPEQDDKRRFGHSRDKRSDCVQVVIALIVTPQGFPLAYEVKRIFRASSPKICQSCFKPTELSLTHGKEANSPPIKCMWKYSASSPTRTSTSSCGAVGVSSMARRKPSV